MTDTVISLRGGAFENERRAAFLQAVATSYDLYVTDHGEEPDALVYVLCGLKQPSRIAWEIQGPSMGGASSILSLAATHCLAEAAAPRRELQ